MVLRCESHGAAMRCENINAMQCDRTYMQSWSFIHARRTVGMGVVGSLEMTLPSLESLPLCMLAGHTVHTATQQRNVNDGGHYEQKAT